MTKFQYVDEGHTLVQTSKVNKEKVKVVTGEIVEIEDGIFSEARLMMAGFQKIIDGAEDILDAAINMAGDVKDSIKAATTTTTATAPEVTEDDLKNAVEQMNAPEAPETSEAEADDVTPAGDVENAPEAPESEQVAQESEPLAVTTEAEDDGKPEITVEVVAKQAKKEAPKKK